MYINWASKAYCFVSLRELFTIEVEDKQDSSALDGKESRRRRRREAKVLCGGSRRRGIPRAFQ